jgi:hypothetical protein
MRVGTSYMIARHGGDRREPTNSRSADASQSLARRSIKNLLIDERV